MVTAIRYSFRSQSGSKRFDIVKERKKERKKERNKRTNERTKKERKKERKKEWHIQF